MESDHHMIDLDHHHFTFFFSLDEEKKLQGGGYTPDFCKK
jgi:hypothetical protein